jgi:outer membrane protein OmpA-like peptidoglycan-associated protein
MEARFKYKLLVGTAAVALFAVAGGQEAAAQYVSGGQAPGTVSVSVEGGYAIGTSTNNTTWGEAGPYYYSDIRSNVIQQSPYSALSSGNGDGFIGRAAIGWQYDPQWSFGIMYTGLRSTKSASGKAGSLNTVLGSPSTTGAYSAKGTVSTKFRADVVDFQAGYDFGLGLGGGVGTALVGLEYGHFVQKIDVDIGGTQSGSPINVGSSRRSIYSGAGPTLGLKGQIPLTGDMRNGFGVTGQAMGGLLIGRLESDSSSYYYNGGSPGTSSTSTIRTRVAETANGQLALTYTAPVGAASSVQLALGYQVVYFGGIRDSANLGSVVGASYGSAHDDLLYHGPFLRLTMNFGVAAAPPPPPAPSPPPAPPQAMKHEERKFIVFFDFDKSTLTPDGTKIVETTAATFKSTGAAHLDLTGYTDLSGTQAYNLKLSERRAETVRNKLVQLGVPPSDIGVYWRGKENPRVPTPDGVREPQNRRVEILMP